MESLVDVKMWARETLKITMGFNVIGGDTEKEAEKIIVKSKKYLEKFRENSGDEEKKVCGWLTSISSSLQKSIKGYQEQVALGVAKAAAMEKRRKEIEERHKEILERESGKTKK